jgi:hypothetical protein
MIKDKTQMMRELRQARKEAGLVRFEDWIKPEHRAQVKKYVARLRASK